MKQSLRLASALLASALAAAACSSDGTAELDSGAGSGGASPAGTGGSGGAADAGSGGRGGSAGAGAGGADAGADNRGSGGAGGAPDGGGRGGTAGGTGGSDGGTASYNPCPTNGDPCKVLPLGDSITFGIQYPGAYRVELFRRAVMANQKITFVGTQSNGPAMAPGTTVPFPMMHEGHSGFTINMIVSQAPNDVQFAPHIILLHAGTNDTYMTGSAGAPMRLSTAVDMLTTMFPNALVVVAKIVPYPAQVANVNLINQSIPDMVQMKAAMGKHVIMADLFTGFDTPTMLSSDGIHPNQTGYNFMGDTWYSVVGGLFRN